MHTQDFKLLSNTLNYYTVSHSVHSKLVFAHLEQFSEHF